MVTSSGSPTPLGNRVYRYTWDESSLTSPTLILDLPVTPAPGELAGAHTGGIIRFGPDGKLYVVIGNLERSGQLQNVLTGSPPDDTGVILRLNDDGTTPSDNPFFDQGGNLAKYYAYGIRNSFGLAFDPVTGRLWDTENGPRTYDEINLVDPGFNSGWEQIMGPDSRDPEGIGDLVLFPGAQYSDPEFSWFDTVGPTAIVFFDSVELGDQYNDSVFVGDIVESSVYNFTPNTARDGFDFVSPDLADLVADTHVEREELIFGTEFGGIVDLKVGPDGLLYVLSFFEGKIFRISKSPVNLTLSSGTNSIPPGGTFPFTLKLENTTSASQPLALTLILKLPTGEEFPLGSPAIFDFPGLAIINQDLDLGPLPLDALLGTWTLKVLIFLPGEEIFDKSFVEFTIN